MQTKIKTGITRNEALNRMAQAVMSGYGDGGANQSQSWAKGYNVSADSPVADINQHLETMRGRTRGHYMNSPIGRSAIDTNRTNVIGAGLRLRSRINKNILRLTPEQASEWEKNTQMEFELFANSQHCDVMRLNNFYDLQDICYVSYMVSGDGWCALKRMPAEPYFPYQLRLHVFEADRVSNPAETAGQTAITPYAHNTKTGNMIISGVEIDKNGAVVAYWVSNKYPRQSLSLWAAGNEVPEKFTRVEAFGKISGRRNLLQVFHAERPEQYRGVPFLAPVIKAIQQLGRYSDAELMRAIILAFLTVFIEEQGVTGDKFGLGESVPNEEKVDIKDCRFELGPGTINTLPPGYKVSTVQSSQTQGVFDSYTTALTRQIGAAIEMPYEVLMKAFTSSYSASRAALLQAWAAFRMRRVWFARDFCQPVYEIWLDEMVATGRISAPGYFVDPLVKAAWCGAQWYGPAPGALDPVKEVQGAAERVKHGYSTHEQETLELTGGDWFANIEQLAQENAMAKSHGVELNADPSRQKHQPVKKGGDNDNEDE